MFLKNYILFIYKLFIIKITTAIYTVCAVWLFLAFKCTFLAVLNCKLLHKLHKA